MKKLVNDIIKAKRKLEDAYRNFNDICGKISPFEEELKKRKITNNQDKAYALEMLASTREEEKTRIEKVKRDEEKSLSEAEKEYKKSKINLIKFCVKILLLFSLIYMTATFAISQVFCLSFPLVPSVVALTGASLTAIFIGRNDIKRINDCFAIRKAEIKNEALLSTSLIKKDVSRKLEGKTIEELTTLIIEKTNDANALIDKELEYFRLIKASAQDRVSEKTLELHELEDKAFVLLEESHNPLEVVLDNDLSTGEISTLNEATANSAQRKKAPTLVPKNNE